MRRQHPGGNKSSSSSYSSITQSSVTSGSERSLNRHGYYVDKVPPPEDCRQFSLRAEQRRRQRAQWQDDRGSSRGFVGRETGRGWGNANDHSMHPSSGRRGHVSSSSSFSTDSELSHGKAAVHSGNPGGGASYQTFLDERTSVPMPLPAEEILMNLGICASGSFIPKRFLCDWVNKTRHLQAQNRQRASQQWIEDRVNACLHHMAQQSQTDDSEDGFSSENFESRSDINEDGSNNRNNRRDSVADNACSQSFSEGVSLHNGKGKGVPSDNGREAQRASPLKSVLDRHSKLLLGNQHDKLREQRSRQFTSQRSRSLTAVPLAATTPNLLATTKRKTSPKATTAAIPEVDYKLRSQSTTDDYVEEEVTKQLSAGDATLGVSPNVPRFGVSEHLFVAKVYTETNEHEDLMIPVIDGPLPPPSSTELPSIVVRDSSPLLMHTDSLEVNNIMANPETKVGDSAFQPMLHPMLSLSRNSSLSSSNCSAFSPSPVTVIEVGCSVARNDIANMDMLGNYNETKQTPVIVVGDTCCDIYECSSGSSSVSATFYDARQWPSSADVRRNSTNEESFNPAINELPRCTSVPAYLPSFNIDEFGVESLFSDSQQNMCFDVDGQFYCSQSTDDGSELLSICADYQESVCVPSAWSVLGSDGDEPSVCNFASQTPVSWDLAGVSSYVSKYIMPYLCGKCQYYIMRTCPSDVLSPIQRDSDDLSPSSLCNGNITNPSQNGITNNQVREDRAHGLFAASNGGTIYAPERAHLSNQRRIGHLERSAFVELRKE